MRKLLLLVTFFAITPVLLSFCLFSLYTLNYSSGNNFKISDAFKSSVSFAALPGVENVVESSINEREARIEAVQNFFKKHQSDLEPYAELMVRTADKYGLDYRLLPSIAMQESNLCKKAPKDSYNCWGFGIYGKKVTRFNDYPEAIESVSKTLALEYKNKGLETPEEIQSVYTPSNKGDWAESVNYFMNQL